MPKSCHSLSLGMENLAGIASDRLWPTGVGGKDAGAEPTRTYSRRPVPQATVPGDTAFMSRGEAKAFMIVRMRAYKTTGY